MNISHENEFIFIHVPKTAGLSISSAIGLDEVKHFDQETIIKKQSSGLDVSGYYKFAFCRNPWDRLLSLYFYVTTGTELISDNKKMNKMIINFDTFCKLVHFDNYICNPFVWDVHYKPQLDFIDPTDIDFVGKFENLQEDFDIICDKINIPRQQLPHKNKSKHKHYTEYYDDETRQIVAEKYAKDIERFGYKFGE